MKVLITGVWSTNKGDRAILTFLIEKLLKNSSIEKIYVSTNNIAMLKKNISENILEKISIIPFGYYESNKLLRIYSKKIAYPILRKNVRTKINKNSILISNRLFLEALKDSDLVIMTGGHHFTTMREKDAIFSLTYDMGLVCCSQKKYVLWSQTIGPLEFIKEDNRTYIETVLKNASQIYIRDENSLDVLKRTFGNLEHLKKSYDSVFGLRKIYDLNVNYVDVKIVGMSIFYSNYNDKKSIETYIEKMKKICRYIISKGYTIKFFPMETSEREIEYINMIMQGIEINKWVIFDTNVQTEYHLREVAKCSLFIGHKTHSVIMALTAGIPIIALCYHLKTKDFMTLFDVEKYSILDYDYNFENFMILFDELELNQNYIKKCLIEKAENVAQIVNNDFEELLKTYE